MPPAQRSCAWPARSLAGNTAQIAACPEPAAGPTCAARSRLLAWQRACAARGSCERSCAFCAALIGWPRDPPEFPACVIPPSPSRGAAHIRKRSAFLESCLRPNGPARSQAMPPQAAESSSGCLQSRDAWKRPAPPPARLPPAPSQTHSSFAATLAPARPSRT